MAQIHIQVKLKLLEEYMSIFIDAAVRQCEKGILTKTEVQPFDEWLPERSKYPVKFRAEWL